ncbi:glutathione S-transferase [Paraglaciecola sp.]|uniref:glutathione S-transferase family protein n=1 Tax=Paraglaciecola sp. TaxID=1920173 RepID=UPI0030F3F3A3
MISLYGFDVSNYYNMIKLALAYKEVDYNRVNIYPNQSPEFLALSPIGKVPMLETTEGCLCETSVILEYIDSQYPTPSLYPSDAFAKAKVKELAKMCELYLELPARRCFPEVFFGQQVSLETKKETKRALIKGIEALARVAKFNPYLAGNEFTAADIFFLYSADMASIVAKKTFDIDLLVMAPGAKELLLLLKEMPLVQQISEDRKIADIEFKKYIASLG